MAGYERRKHVFRSAWWSVHLPDDWQSSEEPECVTLYRSQRRGSLQISAARKQEETVTDRDLQNFAEELIDSNLALEKVSYSTFSGFSVSYSRDARFWKEWWLRSGTLMLYLTYVVALGDQDIE